MQFNQNKLDQLNINGRSSGAIRDAFTEFAVNNTPNWLPEGSGLLIQTEERRKIRRGDYIHKSVLRRAAKNIHGYRDEFFKHLSDPSVPIWIDRTELAQ